MKRINALFALTSAAMLRRSLLCLILLGLALVGSAGARDCGADLCVGPNFALKRPSEAAAVAKDGDHIAIAAGVYEGDVAVFRQNNLRIRGVGGRAHLKANGQHAEGKGIWVIKGNHTTIENIEFSGARVPHFNGAGIRLEGEGLTLRHCYFHDNETGLLTGISPNSDILIEHSEFAGSGAPRGNPHAIYIGDVRSFTLRFSYVHHARVGHNVKSRAHTNYILYNRIMDEIDGSASYAIDFPNGGLAFVIGNIIQQGPLSPNDALIAFGAERLKKSHDINELYLASNTLVNDARDARFISAPYRIDRMRAINNIFSGVGRWFASPVGDEQLLSPGKDGNIAMSKIDFVNAAAFDYRLGPNAAALRAAVVPGMARDTDLTPTLEYRHPLQAAKRGTVLNAGALE